MDKPTEAVPIHGLFRTPESMDEVTAWLDAIPPSERMAATTAAMMTWNYLASEVNKTFGLEVSDERE